jgi:hypothetical protein
MKTFARSISPMLAVLALPVLAAPTVTQQLYGFQGHTPLTSSSFGTSVAAGDDISVQIQSHGNPKGASGPTSADVVITDSVDGVAFVACNFYYDPTNNIYAALYHHIAVSSGTRTITVTQTNITYVEATAVDASGFVGTPTCDNSLNVTGGSTSAASSANLSPAVTGQNSEIAFFVLGDGSYFPTTPSGYTNLNSGVLESGYGIQATSGASVAMNGTFYTSGTWDGVIGGIYDSTGAINPLGINLELPQYYSTEFPFLNVMKSGGVSTPGYYNAGWMTATNSTWPDTLEEGYLQLDSDGYPTSLTASPTPPGGQVFNSVFTAINYNIGPAAPGASYPYAAGQYRLKFEGQGTVKLSGDPSVQSGDTCSGLSLTNSVANTYVSCTFTVVTPSTASGILLSITAITNSVDHPRDISVVQQTYASTYDAGAIFNPAFLTELAPFSSLRFMQWKNINSEFNGLAVSNSSLSSGATSLTLSSAWTEPTGAYPVLFIDGEQRNATFTLGSTTVSWSPGLTNGFSSTCAGWSWQWGSGCFGTPVFTIDQTWASRSKPSNAFWTNADGVPLEIVAALCNQLNTNCHVNVPLMYSDSDIEAMGQLLMSGTGMQSGYSGLSSSLTGTFELSNEMWNPSFNQTYVAGALGGFAWPGQSTGGSNTYWNENYRGMRAAQMASDLQTALGSTIFARVYPTVGAWYANSNEVANLLTTPYWSSGPATNYPLKQLAVAFYWGGNPSSGDCTTMTGVANPLDDFFATLTSRTGPSGNTYTHIPPGGWFTQLEGWISGYISLMPSYPTLNLIVYEGGNNFFATSAGTCSGWPALVTSAERDARMGAAYTTTLNWWTTNVGGSSSNIFSVFNDVSVIGINGAFGLLESVMQPISPLSGAPAKYKAVATFAQ